MIIRPSVLEILRDELEEWHDASMFTKMFILLESATDGRAYSLHELSVALFPDDTTETGAPTAKGLSKTNTLRNSVRRHQINDMIVPFARLRALVDDNGKRASAWVTSNIATQEEWLPVKQRMNSMSEGYLKSVKRFSKVVNTGMVERNRRVSRHIQNLRTREKETITTLARKKKKNSK